jgi:hypothetical protein
MPEELVPIFYVKDGRATAKWYARLGFTIEGEHQFAPGLPVVSVKPARGTGIDIR